MSDIVDLSQFRNKKTADSTERSGLAYEDLSDEQRAALDAMAQERADQEPLPVRTMFAIIVDPLGNVGVVQNIDDVAKLDPEHQPSVDEMYGAMATAMRNIEAQTAAQLTQVGMMQMAAKAQAQAVAAQQDMQIRANLDPKLMR